MEDLVNYPMKNIVVTGPTGAIGLALIQKCIEKGIHVLTVVHENSSRTSRIPQSRFVKIIECNLDKLENLRDDKAIQFLADNQKYDVFYHFAWAGTTGESRNDMKLQTDNIRYSLDAVELAERLGCHTFIGAGSQAEYGRYNKKLTEDTPAFPENGYGMAKLCAGQMTRSACEKRGLRHIWARIFSVYGPGDGDKSMISMVIRQLLTGEKPALTAGEQMWDYLYSKDAAEAMYLLGRHGRDGSVYCLGSGCVKPLREYIEILRDMIDPSLPVGFGEIEYGERQVMYLCADIGHLTADIGFEPKIKFETGIRETVDAIQMEIQTTLKKEM